METKALLQSKTFWANVIMGIAGIFGPKYSQHVNAETITAGFAVANIALRFISKGKVTLK